MLKINKLKEPDFIIKFKTNKSPNVWKDYNSEIKNNVKEFILKNEQQYFCAYCERKIYESVNSHIEHIKPRDLYPSLFQNYENIIISCNDKNSCGRAKGNTYAEEFINPVLENPSHYLEFNLASGEIVPKDSEEISDNNKKAKYTIELLKLNYYKLKEARKNLIDILEVYNSSYEEEEVNKYLQYFLDDGYGFPNLIKLYMSCT